MGSVARIAAATLANRLHAEPIGEIAPDDYFDLTEVGTKSGLLLPMRLPHTRLYACRTQVGGRDLVVLNGERQPTHHVRAFCDQALAMAADQGVVRVFTFAAMATASPPDAPARVFAVATDSGVLSELRDRGAHVLEEGEIAGMNGVFLAAAAERGLRGACLLGEFPFFAGALPQPKAAAAVLRAFAGVAGLGLDLSDLDQQGRELERQLVAHWKRMEGAAQEHARGAAEEAAPAGAGGEGEPEERAGELSPEDALRVEALFQSARHDRGQALALKAELDRLGVFRKYEDRFLDLFRHAE